MKTFLVVEDDPNIRKLLSVNLKIRGHDVQEVGSAEEALKLLDNTLVTALILDIGLPGMNGWALLDMMQQDEILSAIPVLVFSAAIPTTARMYPNVFARLTKPVDLRQFMQVVERMP